MSFLNVEDSDNSEDNLRIVIEKSPRKRKPPPSPTASEKDIIESIEDELEKTLEEKATKANLNVTNVKGIIRHVVTNEHVLHFLKTADKSVVDIDTGPTLVFEPKLTRSKARELRSSLDVPVPNVPWSFSKPASEVQVLFNEDLQEDSSEDEYVPEAADEDGEKEDESEDDRDSSIFSDPPSVEPPSTPTCSDSCTQTNWTEDGVFKIPSAPPQDKDDTTDEATIALRTRSKLSLSSTPLEEIEEAFIPPDITTDMYETDCDNEDWMNFLKTFTRPLEEVVKSTEEEDLDPEYNVLADEEVDKPDKEELRVDKAVKISKKELNDLMDELYEFCTSEQTYICNNDEDDENQLSVSQLTNSTLDNSQFNSSFHDATTFDERNLVCDKPMKTKDLEETLKLTNNQITLLEQQLRQHVQMLTQNFLLTYKHPELHENSFQMKEYLLNFQFLRGDSQESVYNILNLDCAINLISYWENLLNSNTEEVKKMYSYVDKVLAESLKNKMTGNNYIETFPDLIMETISNSDVFIYPELLPKIPFKPLRYYSPKCTFLDSEIQLIAKGLEEFMPLAREKLPKNATKVRLYSTVAEFIHEHMLPIKKPHEITYKIMNSESTRYADNPIKFYLRKSATLPFIQRVFPLDELKILPPCQRRPEELPQQWKHFIYLRDKSEKFTSSNASNASNSSSINLSAINNLYQVTQFAYVPIVKTSIQKPLLPKGPIYSSTPICPKYRLSRIKRLPQRKKRKTNSKFISDDPITKFVKCLGQTPSVSKLLELFPINAELFSKDISKLNEKNKSIKRKSLLNSTMLPNMPSLFTTPVKNDSQNESIEVEVMKEKCAGVKRNLSLSEKKSSNNTTATVDIGEKKKNSKSDKIQETPKDNQDDINALLIASSTVKPTPKKELSGGEKKKARFRKEFLANLNMCTPEGDEIGKKKSEMFALSYYDKMRETLEMETYHKIMQILNDYEEGDAVDLYHKIEQVLRPKYNELADEFLLFLREREAAAVGKLIPWIRMNNRSKFLRKLEIYFKDQPSQLKKIYQCLTELSQSIDISMDRIKTTLLPMFKGNAVLKDLFLQNFMDEPPPNSLLEGPYETIDVNKELARPPDEESFETIIVPDIPDKYGGMTCICSCHEIEDEEYKSRYRHCTRCGAKFLNGKVYMATGRGLRPAKVSFITNPDVDHQTRLADKSLLSFIQRKKRSDNSPSKAGSSYSKENQDEDSEEDGDKKKKPKRKAPTKRNKKQTEAKETAKTGGVTIKKQVSTKGESKPRKRANSVKKSTANAKVNHVESPELAPKPVELNHHVETELEEHNETEIEEHFETEVEEHNETEIEEHNETELEEHNESEDHADLKFEGNLKPGSMNGQMKRLHDESCEEGDQSVRGEFKFRSPEQNTAESESEFCEESSQDNCESDSNSSTSSSPKSYADVLGLNSSWKREEDKIILEVFQKENDKDNAFRAISNQLSNRTVGEIKSRFDTLMDLLMKTVEDA
ncbi:unnamed protein product [Phyllotreta striolata]|uniref:Myb-like domain-containing protein n=1 Tax=Phyllotreta striolata TaxID=444603 RepID=A0A9N9XRU4_PHYSR|nr:unnamed protein product [Phyllotreta striolata]